MAQVGLDRALADAEIAGNFLVGLAIGDQTQRGELSGRELDAGDTLRQLCRRRRREIRPPGDSRAWAVTPALSWVAFDLGGARARLRGAKAGSDEAMAAYEQTVLRALEETENALVAYREEQERLVKLAEQARESARAAGIARARYREGVADFLALLDAERTQLQAEDAVAQAEAGVFTGVVAIYKTFGGIVQ
jgi:outer membrane protein TolC